MMSPPPELQVPTREQQMERLRIGLERLAGDILVSGDHIEKLRTGLEKRARAMNSGQTTLLSSAGL